MPVYVLIEIKILDRDIYAEYVKKVPAIVKKYGGRYIVRGGQITSLFGEWHPERIIVLEFNSAEQVNAWLSSPEYAGVAPLRTQSALTRAIIVEGYSEPRQ